jgi:5-methylcytosine-specific restriction endonuclease McrA
LIPKILILKYYVKLPFKKAAASRQNILRRDLYCCQYCGKEFFKRKADVIKRGGGKFCSRRCQDLWRSKNARGINASNWKGGSTPLALQIRHSFEYCQWRNDVFVKDNFICQTCGIRGGKLEAHHIKKFSKILNENRIKTLSDALRCIELWNINNGKTLCKKHHNTGTI